LQEIRTEWLFQEGSFGAASEAEPWQNEAEVEMGEEGKRDRRVALTSKQKPKLENLVETSRLCVCIIRRLSNPSIRG
jgi:hypothetical protein